MRYWKMLQVYRPGRTKDTLRYFWIGMWLTDAALIFSVAFMRGSGGVFFWPGLVLLLAALGVKGWNLWKIRKGIEGRHMRLSEIMRILYLAVIGLPVIIERRISFVLYLVCTLVFLLGTVGLVMKRGNDCMNALESYYPWIYRKFYKDFPDFDVEKQHERVAELEAELEELYQNTPNPVMKEAIEKRESATAIWILMCETFVLGMILMTWCES